MNKMKLVFKNILLTVAAVPLWISATAQYAPAAGQPGTTAIYKDSSVFINWATQCEVTRGYMDISNTSLGYASAGDSSMALGVAGANGTVSLGDGGVATLQFLSPVSDGPGWDFAVFENGFSDIFLELAFVEVSSDGDNFFRFPAHSLTDTTTQVGSFGSIDPTKINNLAGKYRALYGTPFDLAALASQPGLDISQITHVRIIDVVGCVMPQYTTRDTAGNPVNDPWSTAFPSSGFDLDAVGVIHENPAGIFSATTSVFSIFPNPASASNGLTLSFTDDSFIGSTVNISDANGSIVQKAFIENKRQPVEIKNLNPGFYFVSVMNDEKQSVFKLLILQ